MKTKLSKIPCSLGEGLCISDCKKIIGWVDINNKQIFFYDSNSKKITNILIKAYPSNIFSIREGIALVLSSDGLVSFNINTKQISSKVDFDFLKNNSLMRGNDGLLINDDTLIFGTMTITSPHADGNVYIYDHKKLKKIDKLSIPNLFVQIGEEILIADSAKKIIYKYQLSNFSRKIWFDGSGDKLIPDGGCFGPDGYIYVAFWGDATVGKFSKSGDLLDKLAMPFIYPTNCKALENKLIITSALQPISELDCQDSLMDGHTIEYSL